MSEERFEYAKMKLDVVTPICIGGGKELTPLDYLYDDKEGLVYFVNKKKLSSLIVQNGWLKEFEQYVCSQTGDAFNLYEWLRSKNCHINDIEKAGIILGECEAKVGKKSLNNVSWHIRQADGSVYIPGSSIKGYIRTAILYKLIRENPQLRKNYWAEIEKLIVEAEKMHEEMWNIVEDYKDLMYDYKKNNHRFNQNEYLKLEKNIAPLIEDFSKYTKGKQAKRNKIIKELGELSEKLEKEAFGLLKFPESEKLSNGEEKTLSDVFRGILISDAIAGKTIKTVVLPKRDLVFNRPKGRHRSTTYEQSPAANAECVAPNNVFEFTIKMDKNFTSIVGIESVDDVILLCEKFTADIIDRYKSFFSQKYPSVFQMRKANLNIGSHTGFLRKTVFLALAPNDKIGFEYMADLLDISFAKIYPKTRNQNREPVPQRPWLPGFWDYCSNEDRKFLEFAPRAIKIYPYGDKKPIGRQDYDPNDLLAGMAFMSKL